MFRLTKFCFKLHILVTFINFVTDENNKGKNTFRLLPAKQI